ncbi:MAG: Zn-dependent hydrolase [Anaerolineales bacterium]|nr:MAG: Zn-dependent hydrolase [Anaerolineales bacterium]
MSQTFSSLRINPDRMLDSFNQLAAIGATADSGVDRPTFSEAHLAARKWFREEVGRAGLEFHTDGAGNHSARLNVEPSNLPTLILGSHLDSVPNGGRFDGALGVIAALEVLRTVKENGIRLKVNLEAMDFTDEEGTLVGLLGSAALAGHLRPEHLQNPRGGRENLVAGMKRAGLSDESMLSAARTKDALAGYLELHIEQGKRLERAGADIGIVTAIVGIWSYRLSFTGNADHAGTTTMEDRRDASLGASAFTLAARELVMREFPNCVVNVGKMDVTPGAFNIVPARVDVALEFRSPDEDEFDRLDKALLELAGEEAARFGLELQTEFLGKHSPSLMNDSVRSAFAYACDDLGLSHMSLPSGAGHDAQSLADLCPVGMIFVPSVDGASHSPREFTKWEDCVNGVNVLLQAALRLGSG